MTAVDVSPEQLNAEAVAPSRSLEDAIVLHRALSMAETSILRLHQRDGESGLGPPFSPAFERFLDAFYGTAFPWSAGLKSLRWDCRRNHSEHWSRKEWQGSLCYRLVHLTVREGWHFDRACYELWVDPNRTERVLLRGLRRIEQRLTELASREESRTISERGAQDPTRPAEPAHVHRHPPESSLEDCPQCVRAA